MKRLCRVNGQPIAGKSEVTRERKSAEILCRAFEWRKVETLLVRSMLSNIEAEHDAQLIGRKKFERRALVGGARKSFQAVERRETNAIRFFEADVSRASRAGSSRVQDREEFRRSTVREMQGESVSSR